MSPDESQTDNPLTFRVHPRRRWGRHMYDLMYHLYPKLRKTLFQCIHIIFAVYKFSKAKISQETNKDFMASPNTHHPPQQKSFWWLLGIILWFLLWTWHGYSCVEESKREAFTTISFAKGSLFFNVRRIVFWAAQELVSGLQQRWWTW